MDEKRTQDRTRGQQVESLLERRYELDQAIDECRKDVTILYSDIVGYTRFVRERGDVAGRVLMEKHRRLGMPIVHRYGGVFVKTIGDAVMVRFEHPSPAVEAACSIQRALADQNQSAQKSERFHLRIGIASGRAIIEPDDVNGDVVNVASRLCKMAEENGILICERTYRGLDPFLAGLSLPMPEQRVRGIEKDAVRPHRVVWKTEGPARARDADVEVLVLDVARENGTLKLSLHASRHETVTLYERIPWNESVVAQAGSEVVQALKRATAVKGRTSLDEVRSAGAALYDVLLTQGIKKHLKETSCRHLIIRLQDTLVRIPWELLYDGSHFLGNRFAVGRLVTSREQARQRPPRATLRPGLWVISDPRNDLPSAEQEGTELVSRLTSSERLSVTMKAGAGIEYVRKALHTADLIHYCGHAEYDDDNPSASGWLLADGRLTAADVLQMGEGSDVCPLLVFANACHSGRAEEWSAAEQDRIYGLAKAFLLAGVKHYIGTLWEILDCPSREFAARFYDSLIRGNTIGEALREARENLIRSSGEECLIWASYLLYGDPTIRVFGIPASEKEAGEPPAGEQTGPEATTEEPVPIGASVQADYARSRPTQAGSRIEHLSVWRRHLWVLPVLILAAILVWKVATDLGSSPSSPLEPPDPSDTSAMLAYLSARAREAAERGEITEDRWTSRPLSVAHLPIESQGTLPPESPDPERVRTFLYREYAASPGVQPVERDRLDLALTELNIGSSDLADGQKLARLGQMVFARFMFVGRLMREGESASISFHLFECETSEIVCPDVLHSPIGVEALALEVARVSLECLKKRYPIRGRITAIEEENIYLNIGSTQGVQKGQRFGVIAEPLRSENQNKGLSRQIGEIEVLQWDTGASLAKVKSQEADFREGMKVEIILESDLPAER